VLANEAGFSRFLCGISHSLGRRHGSQSVTQPVNAAALEVNAAKAVRCAERRCLIEQRASLSGVDDIATKKNDSSGPYQLQPCTLQSRELSASEAHYEQASRCFTNVRRKPSFKIGFNRSSKLLVPRCFRLVVSQVPKSEAPGAPIVSG